MEQDSQTNPRKTDSRVNGPCAYRVRQFNQPSAKLGAWRAGPRPATAPDSPSAPPEGETDGQQGRAFNGPPATQAGAYSEALTAARAASSKPCPPPSTTSACPEFPAGPDDQLRASGPPSPGAVRFPGTWAARAARNAARRKAPKPALTGPVSEPRAADAGRPPFPAADPNRPVPKYAAGCCGVRAAGCGFG